MAYIIKSYKKTFYVIDTKYMTVADDSLEYFAMCQTESYSNAQDIAQGLNNLDLADEWIITIENLLTLLKGLTNLRSHSSAVTLMIVFEALRSIIDRIEYSTFLFRIKSLKTK